ncbi:MAG: cytochrome d ubiquinol oxidase subunit II [Cytophagaceae bacterium]|nr:cytochrome d ubiquinol oxidase subunit II [Gemmatimonadaceae bacterium]
MNADTSILPTIIALVMAVAINGYLLLGGADFGGGVWDLLASGPRRARQRALIADSIGPVWEVNHVWLILVVVLLFSCFPSVFAIISVELHIPLTLMLIGVVLRGSAFTFRTYDAHHDDVQRRWGLVFSISSVLTPALLGICVGAIASGAVARASHLEGVSFAARFIAPWANPFVLTLGVLTLALCAFLAAVYLTYEAGEDVQLQDDFRRRAFGAAGVVFVAAFGALALSGTYAPNVRRTMGTFDVSFLLHLATGAFVVFAILALMRRSYRVARVFAAAHVSCFVWGWAFSTYPWILPPDVTFVAAAAPDAVLELILVALALGALVLAPSLVWLFRVFKRQPAAFDDLHEETTGEFHAPNPP